VQRAREALGVFERQRAEAAVYVADALRRRGLAPGEKLRW
jgi:hypothetical protein